VSAQANGPGAEPGGSEPGAGPADPVLADPVLAETYLRLIAEAELRRGPVISGPGPQPHRVWLAATTMAAARVISVEAAWRVVARFEAAAALRTGNRAQAALSGIRVPGWVTQYGALQQASSRPGASGAGASGPGRRGAGRPGTGPTAGAPEIPAAVEVSATLPLPAEQNGWYGEFCLLSLARTDSRAVLTVAARWAGQTRRAAVPCPRHPPWCEVGAVDDRGISYQASLWDGGNHDEREWWDCHLTLNPAPAPETRWLEVGPGAHGRRVRIDLGAPPGAARIVTGPVPPASAAARLLAWAGDGLLALEAAGPRQTAPLRDRIAQILQDLTGAGALQADDPAVLRLTGLAWRLGLDLGPGQPVRPVTAAALPPAWASLLEVGHVHDGPDAIAPFTADLPEIGGGRFALAGLRSARHGVTLHVMAHRWEPHDYGWLTDGTGSAGPPPDLSLTWRAQDSAGRWHLVRGMHWGPESETRGMIKMYLTPPLHPAARALDVIVTGPSTQARATVPLNWVADPRDSRPPGPEPGGTSTPPGAPGASQ
jgi:hypothetical protein